MEFYPRLVKWGFPKNTFRNGFSKMFDQPNLTSIFGKTGFRKGAMKIHKITIGRINVSPKNCESKFVICQMTLLLSILILSNQKMYVFTVSWFIEWLKNNFYSWPINLTQPSGPNPTRACHQFKQFKAAGLALSSRSAPGLKGGPNYKHCRARAKKLS